MPERKPAPAAAIKALPDPQLVSPDVRKHLFKGAERAKPGTASPVIGPRPTDAVFPAASQREAVLKV